jgi:hypothetical protein
MVLAKLASVLNPDWRHDGLPDGAQQRTASFKGFMEEWIVDRFFRTLDEFGLKKPWYRDIFLDESEL